MDIARRFQALSPSIIMRTMTAGIQTDPPAFLCDEMLLGLGKWLRAAGYDTALSPAGARDRLLVEQSQAEHRLLLTRDRRMPSIHDAEKVVVLLQGNSMSAWAGELALIPGVDWLLNPFSRCLLCNRILFSGQGGLAVPEWIVAQCIETWHCPDCRRAYWHGSHVRRMLAQLQSFAKQGEQARACSGQQQDAGNVVC